MTEPESRRECQEPGLDLTDADVLAAMGEIPGYLDITPRDFKEIYLLAYCHAKTRLALEKKAGDIMTREVAAVDEQTPLVEVATLMGEREISGVPVLNSQGQVTGVISAKDFLVHMGAVRPNFMAVVASCLKTKGCLALPMKNKVARDIMSSPAVVVSPETSLQEIAALLAVRRINRVPVVDQQGQLVGLVSRADLVQALSPGGQIC
jgi:CBS domain-containing membrane protein